MNLNFTDPHWDSPFNGNLREVEMPVISYVGTYGHVANDKEYRKRANISVVKRLAVDLREICFYTGV